MINIEIHGLPSSEALETREKIFNHLQHWELVVTIVADACVTRDGADRPFLRLYGDNGDSANMLHYLKQLRLDIEMMPRLSRYLPVL